LAKGKMRLYRLRYVQVEEASYLTAMKQKEVQDLALKLEMAGTDDFIANEARTQYGYLAPGEIRFIVTNKEALWGESSPVQP
jgi:cell division protein FtsB